MKQRRRQAGNTQQLQPEAAARHPTGGTACSIQASAPAPLLYVNLGGQPKPQRSAHQKTARPGSKPSPLQPPAAPGHAAGGRPLLPPRTGRPSCGTDMGQAAVVGQMQLPSGSSRLVLSWHAPACHPCCRAEAAARVAREAAEPPAPSRTHQRASLGQSKHNGSPEGVHVLHQAVVLGVLV